MVLENITERLDYDKMFSCTTYIGMDDCIDYIDYMQNVNCDIMCVMAL